MAQMVGLGVIKYKQKNNHSNTTINMETINRTELIHDKTKWEVNQMLDETSNRIPFDNGYFGRYTLVTFKGKKAIVFVDDRDAKVKVRTGWYDDILYGSSYEVWSGDYRWNSDKPVVVKNDGLCNINAPHCNNLLCEEWMKCIDPKTRYINREHFYPAMTIEGRNVFISIKGTVRGIDEALDASVLYEQAKKYTLQQVEEWIEQGKPCAHIRGLEYKGAHAGKITKEKAKEYFKTHNQFHGMFNSAEWRIMDGAVTLLFRDYADSDYD